MHTQTSLQPIRHVCDDDHYTPQSHHAIFCWTGWNKLNVNKNHRETLNKNNNKLVGGERSRTRHEDNNVKTQPMLNELQVQKLSLVVSVTDKVGRTCLNENMRLFCKSRISSNEHITSRANANQNWIAKFGE